VIKSRVNGLAYGTIRRAPAPSFAHAILLDQPDNRVWQIIDLYGPMELVTDNEVKDWPVAYTPVDDEEWEK
jgi:hypothetical protein